MISSIQEPKWQQDKLLKQFCDTVLPNEDKLKKIASLYKKAFAGYPWYECKVCPCKHYFGEQYEELKYCTKGLKDGTTCNQPLEDAYPEKKVIEEVTEEVTKLNGTLITFEKEGKVLAAGWGYECTPQDLQAKYISSEMQKKVVDKIEKEAGKVQGVFYLSEIMVDNDVQNQGIATTITNCLINKATQLNLKLVMRTHKDSPMVTIATMKMQMIEIIKSGEDKDEGQEKRVLFIKI